MFLSNHHSFTIVSKKSLKKKDDFVSSQIVEEEVQGNVNDDDRRNFLKILGGASVGAAVLSMIPSKAQAYIIGSSPTAGIVGVKNSLNVGVNPATEDGNLATLTAKDFATEASLTTLKNKDFATQTTLATRASETTLASIKTNSDKFLFDVSGNLLTASSGGGGGGAVTVNDTNNAQINPATDEGVLYLRRIVKLMESQAVVDNQMRQRITIDSLGGVTPVTTTIPVSGTLTAVISSGTLTTVSSVTSVSTVSAVTSLNQIAGVDSRWQIIDWSRQAYNSGIRGNLITS